MRFHAPVCIVCIIWVPTVAYHLLQFRMPLSLAVFHGFMPSCTIRALLAIRQLSNVVTRFRRYDMSEIVLLRGSLINQILYAKFL